MLISLVCSNCEKTTSVGRGKFDVDHDVIETSIPCLHCHAVYRVTVIQLRVGDENVRRDPKTVASTYLPDGTAVPIDEYPTRLTDFVRRIEASKADLSGQPIQSPGSEDKSKKIQSGS